MFVYVIVVFVEVGKIKVLLQVEKQKNKFRLTIENTTLFNFEVANNEIKFIKKAFCQNLLKNKKVNR